MMKTKGQKNLFSRAYIQTDHLIGKPGGPTSNYYHLKETVECMVRLDFPTTNNEAEYEALVAGLDLAKAARATSVVIYCDS